MAVMCHPDDQMILLGSSKDGKATKQRFTKGNNMISKTQIALISTRTDI
jgi:hypothetical protein